MLIFSNVLNLMYLRGVLLAQPFWRIVESMSSGTIIWFRRINFHRFQEHVPYYNVVILQSKFKYFLGSTIQAIWHAKWSPLLLLTSCSVKQLSQILDLRKAGWGHCKEWNRHNWEKTYPISISILRWKGIVCCHHLKLWRYDFHLCIAEHKRNGENLQDSLHIWKCAFCD